MKEIKLPLRLGRRTSLAPSTISHGSNEDRDVTCEDDYPFLRKKRKRSLSIPILEPARVGLVRKKLQETFDQRQSLLLSMLPAEVRLLIWEMVLGGKHLHIFDWSRKIGHLACCPDEQSPSHLPQVCLGPLDFGRARGCLHKGPIPFLSLPLTCRRIYTESIDLIYSKNTFHFLNFRYRMSSLSTRVLPQRWNCIRTLYLTHFQPRVTNYQDEFFLSRWRSQCSLLAGMPNIHQLVIGLVTRRIEYMDDDDPDQCIRDNYLQFLQILTSVHVVGTFDVYVPYSDEETLKYDFFQDEVIPFRLRQLPTHILSFYEAQSRQILMEQAIRRARW